MDVEKEAEDLDKSLIERPELGRLNLIARSIQSAYNQGQADMRWRAANICMDIVAKDYAAALKLATQAIRELDIKKC